MIQAKTLQNVLAAGLSVALLSTAIGSSAMATNHFSKYGSQQIYRDGNFGQISNQLRQNLLSSGYYVMDIQADGSNRINVYAKKNNQPYELSYTYPGLKLISSKQKDWSNVWQDKNKYHQNGNRYNRNNDVEARIKNESRYPAVKQRAIRKINDMGYKVKDIEIDEQNNRGVFEVDAKRSGQDYKIVLSYPELNVIKLEKD